MTADESNLSLEQLTRDTVNVYNDIVSRHKKEGETLKVLLVGHSLGGAIAVRAARTNELQGLCGLVVLDVVEGDQ